MSTGLIKRNMLLLAVPLAFAGTLVSAELPQRYAVVLQDAPLARQVFTNGHQSRGELRTSGALARQQKLLDAQENLKLALKNHAATALGSMQVLANAIFVTASPQRAAELRALPGVAAVVPMRAMRPKLNKALDLISATTAWAAVGGGANAGAGVKIAILDTGLDETHPGFQDSTLPMPPGFPKSGNADDATHTSTKVIAVRSFVSLLAIGDGTPELTRPDDLSARDRNGHGTATAMITAGVAHQSPIGPISGVAPKAWLGNYKIFGSPGVNDATTSDVVLQALEAAFNDGMDVALLSAGDLSALWASGDQGATCGQTAGIACDPLIGAVSAAALGGMTIVLPAGNDGASGWGTINTPGDYSGAITVGATVNAHIVAATVSTAAGDKLAARQGDGPQLPATLTAVLTPVASIDATEHGCLGFPATALSGSVALISVGDCDLATKVSNAQAAGAIAVLLFDGAATQLLTSPTGLGGTGIPAVHITAASGVALKQYVQANPGAKVTIAPTTVEFGAATSGVMAGFSSQGPNIGDLAIKPDLVAPGAGIYTAAQNYDPNGDLYSASRYTAVDGTSFAAALVAGGAALVKQSHPGHTPAQIQSALADTASTAITATDANGTSVPARSIAMGGGQMNLGAAVSSTVTAVPASIGFGVPTGQTMTRNLALTNAGTSSVTLQLSVVPRDADARASVTVSPSSLNLAAGASTTVSVALSGGASAAGIYEGVIQIAGGAVAIHVPYLYLVGDGKPYWAIPLSRPDFVTESSTAVDLAFRVLDQFGVPVSNMPVRFAPSASVYVATPATDSLGIAEAYMNTTQAAGMQVFEADLVGNAARAEFKGRTRLRPQVAANGILDAASLQAPAGFAPGSYITIFGSGLSETAAPYRTQYLPLSLAGVSVSFDSTAAGIHVPAHLSYASSGQINVQIPWELAGLSQATMKVTLSDSASKTVRPEDKLLGTYQSQIITVPLASYSPAFFEYPDSSTGQRLAAALDENYRLVGSANPVLRGHAVQLFVNGLGSITSGTQPASGEQSPALIPATTAAKPTVMIGGQPAQVQFSGLAPGLVGLYQVNAIVPDNIGTGAQVLSLSIGGVTAPTTLIWVQ